MERTIPLDPAIAALDSVDADERERHGDHTHEILRDVAFKKLLFVNVVFHGESAQKDWVLIDAGLPGMGGRIEEAGVHRFNSPPACIILTHGHFDHAGSLEALARRWNVPIYAHPLEH